MRDFFKVFFWTEKSPAEQNNTRIEVWRPNGTVEPETVQPAKDGDAKTASGNPVVPQGEKDEKGEKAEEGVKNDRSAAHRGKRTENKRAEADKSENTQSDNNSSAAQNKPKADSQPVENKDYFAASDGVEVIYLEGPNQAGKEDPHAWLNLENGIIYAKNIAKQLIAKDPKNKDFYEKNLAAYTEKLSKLDQEAKQAFKNIPEDKKMIVTSEGCFKYFSKAYGVPSSSVLISQI